jgi:hypothetical protein
MEASELVTVAAIGIVHLFIGLAVGRSMRPRNEVPADSRATWREIVHEFSHDLTGQLRSLFIIRDKITEGLNEDPKRLIDLVRSQLEQVIHIVKQGQEAASRVNSITAEKQPSRETSDASLAEDTASLAKEAWFPKAIDPSAKSTEEQRKTRRFAFDRLQWIAPTSNDTIPDDAEFFEVRFRDISTGGFAFLTREPLETERLVAKLGAPPCAVLVLAEIAHQRETWYEGAWIYHVGCKILRRLSSEIGLASAAMKNGRPE